jgi:hypothetical protein
MTSTVALPTTTTASSPMLDYRSREMTGMAFGALIMVFFGCMWLGWALGSMGLRAAVVIAAVLAFAASLWIPAYGLLRKGLRASKQAAPLTAEQEREQSRMGKMFGIVFGAEGLLIFLAVNVLNNLGLGDYAISAIAAIVGLHFLPLARLFHRPMYYLVGVIMTIAALASIAIPASVRISGLASAISVILWVTCVLIIRTGFALGREIHVAK